MKALKIIGFLVVCLAITVIAFTCWTVWRSGQAWANYKRAVEARGERLDPAAYIPPPVPDEQNFAMTPFLAPLFNFKPGTQQPRDTNAVERVRNFAKSLPQTHGWVRWNTGQRVDLVAYRDAFQASSAEKRPPIEPQMRTARELASAAPAVLAALRQYDPVIEELRVASRRPYARFNQRYEEPFWWHLSFPHLPVIRDLCRILLLRASAQLAAGQTDQAFNDLELMFRVTDSVKDEPVFLMQLVRMGCFSMTIQVVWEGMADHQWSEAQLKSLQHRLMAFDFLAYCRWTLQAERACFGNAAFEFLRKSPNKMQALVALRSEPPTESTVARSRSTPFSKIMDVFLGPWLEQDQITYNRELEKIFRTFDLAARRVYPELADANAKAADAESAAARRHIFAPRLVTELLLPPGNTFVKQFAYAQISADEATIACALERYWLAHKQYPKSLDALVPPFIEKLPHDVVSGRSLKYRCLSNGTYVLYSIGWNNRDDDGAIVFGEGKSPGVDYAKGDWVWRLPDR